MRSIAKEFHVLEWTIRVLVHQDIQYKSYVIRKGQFILAKTQKTISYVQDSSLTKLKNPPSMAYFDFSLTKNTSTGSGMMQTKYPATVMVLSYVSSKGDVMSPNIFPQGLKLNAAGYTDVPKTGVKPWIDRVCNGRPHVFQEDCTFSQSHSNPGLIIRKFL